jgi:hypothetical protein
MDLLFTTYSNIIIIIIIIIIIMKLVYWLNNKAGKLRRGMGVLRLSLS